MLLSLQYDWLGELYIKRLDLEESCETGKNTASNFFYADHDFMHSGDVYRVTSSKVDLSHWMNEVAKITSSYY